MPKKAATKKTTAKSSAKNKAKAAPAKNKATAPAATKKKTTTKSAPVPAQRKSSKSKAAEAQVKQAETSTTVNTTAALVDSDNFTKFVTALRDLCNSYLAGSVTATAEASAEDAAQAARRAELEKMSLKALRKMAVDEGFPEDDVRKVGKNDIIDALLDSDNSDDDADEDDEADDVDDEAEADDDTEADDEADEDDESDSDDEEDEDEDEDEESDDDDDDDEADDEADDEDEDEDSDEVEFTREDLLGKGLRELKALAIEHREATKDELSGLDKDSVIDIILGEAEEDEAEDEDDGEGEGYYSEEDLMAMSPKELVALGKENGVKLSKDMDKKKMVKKLLA